MNHLMTPVQAAGYLNFSVATMAKWRCNGDGPAYIKVSARCVRYRLEDLQAWLASRIARHTAQPLLRAVA